MPSPGVVTRTCFPGAQFQSVTMPAPRGLTFSVTALSLSVVIRPGAKPRRSLPSQYAFHIGQWVDASSTCTLSVPSSDTCRVASEQLIKGVGLSVLHLARKQQRL